MIECFKRARTVQSLYDSGTQRLPNDDDEKNRALYPHSLAIYMFVIY